MAKPTAEGTPLSPLEERVWCIKQQNTRESWKNIGQQVGKTRVATRDAYKRACLKIKRGTSPPLLDMEIVDPHREQQGWQAPHPKSTERLNPDVAAQAMDLLSDPFTDNIMQVARECGVPYEVARNVAGRLNTRYLPFKEALQPVKEERLVLLLQNISQQLMESISLTDIHNAPLRDKAVAIGIFIEKMRLLSNQSTQNISIEARANIIENIAPMIYREIQRRGMNEVMDPEVGSVALTVPESGI